jgi:iron complex outermembrane receptor protein
MNVTALKAGFLFSCAAGGILSASPALAQNSPAATDDGAIIVTARRVEERLQDVPISITVFSQEDLAKRNIVQSADLATYTPSLSINQQFGPDKGTFALRGFVQDQATAPSVGAYFAEVSTTRVQGSTTSTPGPAQGSFVDLQNVQVLKGPQGTLFGRNTTGGAILLVPQKPTGRLEGFVEGSLGDYDLRRITGVVNVPLAETFKVRLMVDRNKRDGYIINRSDRGVRDYNNINYFAARLSIVADLTPDLENYTIATYSRTRSHGYVAHIEACNPAATSVTATAGCAQVARQNARGDSVLNADVNGPNPFFHLRTWSVINTTTWHASDNLTVKNIASFSEYYERASFSVGGENFFRTTGTPVRFQVSFLDTQAGQPTAAANQITEELQFQGKGLDGKLEWQIGGYYEKSIPIGWSSAHTSSTADCLDAETLTCTDTLGGAGNISASRVRYGFTDKGLYAQGTYNFTDQLALTGGIRYTWDKGLGTDEATRLVAPNFSTRVCNNRVLFKGTGPGNAKIVTDRAQCHVTRTTESDAPTWLINIDYKPTPDLMLYAKYSRGYRAGGLNMTNVGLESWDAEKVDSYEGGIKATFSGAVRGYVNVSGFYNNFTNQQIFSSLIAKPDSGLAGGAGIVNAGKSRIYGAEVEAAATFFDSLRVQVGYSYLNATLQSIIIPTLPAESPFSAILPPPAGTQLTLTPKNRATVTLTYTLPLPESVGRLSVGGTLTHTDRQLATAATLPQYRYLPKTDLLNLNVDWSNVAGLPVDASFFMTNATNKKYPVAVRSFYNSFGYEGRNYAAPRMWGVRLRYRFGE